MPDALPRLLSLACLNNLSLAEQASNPIALLAPHWGTILPTTISPFGTKEQRPLINVRRSLLSTYFSSSVTIPFFCGSSNRASRCRQDRLSRRSKGHRRLRKGLTQCARRVAAFESSEEYTTMAPWAAEAYSWDPVLQYLEDTRIATSASASMYQTAPSARIFFAVAACYLFGRRHLKPVYRASYEGDSAYSDDETASVNSAHSSSAASASSSSSAASYTTARTSLVSKPAEQRLPIRPLIPGPRIELYPGRHPDKPLVCPSEHVLAHNDFVPETEWDTYEDWDVNDDSDWAAEGGPTRNRSCGQVLDLLAQHPRRKPLSVREECEASVHRVQHWLDSLAPRYVSYKTAAPPHFEVLDEENELFAWPSPSRPLRRTVAYPEIGRVFQDCEQWPTPTFTGGHGSSDLASAPTYSDPEAKFRGYLLNRGALYTYLRTLQAARARALAQQGGAAPGARAHGAAPTTRAFHSRRLRRQLRKLPPYLAKMLKQLEWEERRRRREARRAWARRNESTERVGRMRRSWDSGECSKGTVIGDSEQILVVWMDCVSLTSNELESRDRYSSLQQQYHAQVATAKRWTEAKTQNRLQRSRLMPNV
ncbi:hypothetical protein K523DRAFT_328527 [Schizophyllum commune Tattone D]|nr:hypothetical protein K523DRAFT_328527 [Schizophyllum commune Tattone D]